jgi:hypothetical protein
MTPLSACSIAIYVTTLAGAQPPDGSPPKKGDGPPKGDVLIGGDEKGPPRFGPGGAFGGPPGGPMGGGEIKLIERFDKNGDGRLDKEERKPALEALKKERPNRGGFGPPGGFGGGRGGGGPPFGPPGGEGKGPPDGKDMKDFDRKGEKGGGRGQGPMKGGPGRMFGGGGPPGMKRDPAKPGKKISQSDIKPIVGKGLYDLDAVRTVFLDFDSDGWEKEMAEFHGTDVEIGGSLTVDGKKYPGVGVHFRGASSYFMIPEGYKRSLNVSLDFTDSKQRLMGKKTLNLLNMNDDPSCMNTVLYSAIASKYVPTPKANFVRVVINGENWGLYTNVEQFDKDFVEEHFKSAKGARWKVSGSPMGRGGLEYLGDEISAYRSIYAIKSSDDEKAWKKLVKLCKTLNQTPLDQLEEKLSPMLDVDGVLKFLAVENALVNCDGYWIRASDYSLVLDSKGVFHVVPHDMNEAFRAAMGPGMGPPPFAALFGGGKKKGGGPAGNDLDPLLGLDDAKKPLRSRLLAVPKLRDRYLEYVKQIAREDLDPKTFLPMVAHCKKLIEKDLAEDTRKLTSIEDFRRATGSEASKRPEGGFGRPSMTLKEFAEQRRKYLLAYKPAPMKTAAHTDQGGR